MDIRNEGEASPLVPSEPASDLTASVTAPTSATSRRRFLRQAATAAVGAGIAAASLLGTTEGRAEDADPAITSAKPPSGRGTSDPDLSATDLDPDRARTILDEVGRLQGRRVTPETFATWKRQLNKSRLIEAAAPRKAALLHLLVGEYLLAENGGNEPAKAGWHFRRARQLAGVRDRLHGWAAYDEALGLYYEGGYGDSATATRRRPSTTCSTTTRR